MDNFFPDLLVYLLIISITFSIVLMTLIQKFKILSFINKPWYANGIYITNYIKQSNIVDTNKKQIQILVDKINIRE